MLPLPTLLAIASEQLELLLHGLRNHRPFPQSPHLFQVLQNPVFLLAPYFALWHPNIYICFNNYIKGYLLGYDLLLIPQLRDYGDSNFFECWVWGI